jgi:ubiquinone biosynthesis protein COQ4
MAMIADAADYRAEPRAVSTKMDWGHAWSSLQKLLADKEDTRQVFEIMRALNGSSTAKGYLRLLETPRAAASPMSGKSSPAS